ncbi:MAG: hypothetical protein QOH95_140, partial [Gaiellaceae bacterium]|nr:hypothetical protein [Gaiellaceae bacterium]
WYNRPFNITFLGTDTGSGGVTCSPGVGGVQHYAGPDVAAGTLDGTCTDAAGNSASMSFPFAYDDTPPDVTASASRTPDVDNWYNAPVSVSFGGTDAMSGGVTCDAPVQYAGPDSSSVPVAGTCIDAAGNPAPASLDLSYDATAPTVAAVADRVPDHNGWYNAPVAVAFAGSDAVSGGVTCDSTRLYSAPDAADAAVIGTCSDAAGNYASGALDLAYDATGPTVSVDPSRPADHNGWYNSAVSFTTNGSDATSGLASCSLPQNYFTPDTATGSANGSCTDAAGNVTTSAAGFKYDSTAPTALAAPSAPAGPTGWRNAPFSVGFTGTDATSSPVTCSPAISYSAPDSAAASVSGSCTDQAGNPSAPATFSFKYDATAPSVTALLSRVADRAGWYNHAVDVSFSGTDATSSGVTCDAATTFGGPDTSHALVAGSCSDAAGNSASGSVGFSYDATGPVVTPTPARAANAAGWYRAPVSVSFGGADALSGNATCDGPVSYGGPDTTAKTLTGNCTDVAGNTASGSFTVHYDATAPTVHTAIDRLPDSGIWYNRAVSVSFTGDDSTSGLASCDAAKIYSAPDSAAASVSGSCTDAAGNQGSAAQTFAFDATAPTVTLTAARPPDAGGRYRAPVSFSVSGTDATSGGVLCDGPATYAGPDSAAGIVNGACTDAAGNRGTGSASLIYDSTPPNTSLLSTPAALTNHTSDTISFASTETGSTFSCTIDGVTSACSSPATVSGLTEGAHTFTVAAIDQAGNTDPTPASVTWTVDTTAPDTTFPATGVPDPVSNIQASFTIQSEANARFECSLDNAPFTACTSPVSLGLLPDGSHTFRARAIDGAGNVDPTPASYTWTVDRTAPVVTLTTTPSALSNATTTTFTWTTNEPASFTCSLDGAAFTSCSAGLSTSGSKTLTSLTQVTHTFAIRATDGAGNKPTPATAASITYTWTVDTGPPDTLIDSASKPLNPTGSTSAAFTFTSTEAGS